VRKERLASTITFKTTLIRGTRSMDESAGATLLAKRGLPSKRMSQDTKNKWYLFSKDIKATSFSHVMLHYKWKFPFSYPRARVRVVERMVNGSAKEATAVNYPLSCNLYMGITKHGVTRAPKVAGTNKSKTTNKNKEGARTENIVEKES
jgi:hypothetical protein